MAAPMVAGVAGLVWSVNKSFSGATIKDIVCKRYGFGLDTLVKDNPASPNATGDFKLVNAEHCVVEALWRTYGVGSIEGAVFDNDTRLPLQNVVVTAYNADRTKSFTKKTYSTGGFNFSLPAGTYTLEFNLKTDEYQYTPVVLEADIESAEVSGAGDLVDLGSIYMKKKDASQTGDDGTTNWDFIVPVTHQKTVPAGYVGISTPQQLLNNIRNDLSGNYILMGNIDLSGWGNWEPIGSADNPFTGAFDGNGYVVKNMTIEIDNADFGICVGLFGWVYGGTIKNVGMVNSHVSFSSPSSSSPFSPFAGGIAGYNNSGSISNCYNSGNIFSSASSYCSSYAGGIAGYNSGSISNCHNSGNIFSSTTSSWFFPYAGGIAGENWGSISNCNSTGNISASSAAYSSSNSYAGGIAGENRGSISNCYNTGNIYSDTLTGVGAFAGGIVGRGGGIINNCYNTGSVSASSTETAPPYAGGIAGHNWDNISNCYNTGIVSAFSSASPPRAAYAGGIAGRIEYDTSSNNCYYLNIIDKGIGEGINDSTVACTAAEMRQASTFVGFDFNTVWAIDPSKNDGFPYLRSLEP